MKGTPCYGCEERHVNCHADCEEYIEFQKRREEERQASKEFCSLYNYEAEAAKRRKKYDRKRKGRSK